MASTKFGFVEENWTTASDSWGRRLTANFEYIDYLAGPLKDARLWSGGVVYNTNDIICDTISRLMFKATTSFTAPAGVSAPQYKAANNTHLTHVDASVQYYYWANSAAAAQAVSVAAGNMYIIKCLGPYPDAEVIIWNGSTPSGGTTSTRMRQAEFTHLATRNDYTSGGTAPLAIGGTITCIVTDGTISETKAFLRWDFSKTVGGVRELSWTGFTQLYEAGNSENLSALNISSNTTAAMVAAVQTIPFG